jgi:hypothetical protein
VRVAVARLVSRFACLLLAACDDGGDDSEALHCPPKRAAVEVTQFHGDARRLGWNDAEGELTPAALRAGKLALRWRSQPFDAVEIEGRSYEAHAYASPLYADGVALGGGRRASLVIAATSNGIVYAVSAFDSGCGSDDAMRAGAQVWKAELGTPRPLPDLDHGMPMGVLGTPLIDRERSPARVYVAALDAAAGWRVFALELANGRVLDGWPVAIDDAALAAVNSNGPARFHEPAVMSQRAALALAPGGDLLYVGFGTYRGQGVGWLVAIDTERPAVAHAFSSAPFVEPLANGGIWGSAGPTVAADGDVFLTTGNSPAQAADAPRTFGNSLLQLDAQLGLRGSYTPFNYCALDAANIDLAGSQPLLLPELPGSATATPRLIAFGGKQGNVYLIDRDRIAPRIDRRPPCGSDPAADESLLPPAVQAQLDARGPLNVFGPYSDRFGEIDYAKMRSKLAYYRDADGSWLFASGASKRGEESTDNVPPSLVKLQLVLEPDRPAYLRVARSNPDVVFVNAGSPFVSSDGDAAPIVWVLDENAPRSASLLEPDAPRPVLYAFDGDSLELLWRSAARALGAGGKYATPVIAHGRVFVASDRLYAFGVE